MPPTITPSTGTSGGFRLLASYAAGQRPQTIDQGLALLNPYDYPITAMLSTTKAKKAKDPLFTKFTKALPLQGGAITAVYTDALVTAYVAGVNAAGLLLYVNCAAAVAGEFRARHTVALRNATDIRGTVPCTVEGVVINGANSYVLCRTLAATAATPAAGPDPATAATIYVIGNANEIFSTTPDTVAYNPIPIFNYCQIFRTPFGASNTDMNTELVTGDCYREEKREKGELYMGEMEKTLLFGIRATETVSGKTKYYCGGIYDALSRYASDRIYDYAMGIGDATLTWPGAGTTWLAGGKPWLDSVLQQVSIYGPMKRYAYCGSGVFTALAMLAESYGTINLRDTQDRYGFQIKEWMAPTGLTLNLMHHPLLTRTPGEDNTMLIVPPGGITEYYLRQTKTEDITVPGTDGKVEQYISEKGWLFEQPYTFAAIRGVGLTHV